MAVNVNFATRLGRWRRSPVRPACTTVLNERPCDVDCPPEEADLQPRGAFNLALGVPHQDAASDMPRGSTAGRQRRRAIIL